jgi:hypothetical protein
MLRDAVLRINFGNSESIPTSPTPDFVTKILIEYNGILYRESNLQINFDDLTAQHKKLKLGIEALQPRL